MDKITAVALLCVVLLGNRRDPLPPNLVQWAKQLHRQAPQAEEAEQNLAQSKAVQTVTPSSAAGPATAPQHEPNYISDDKVDNGDKSWSMDQIPDPHPGIRRSKRILQNEGPAPDRTPGCNRAGQCSQPCLCKHKLFGG